MIFDAISFADQAHKGQYRKGTKLPYLTHLLNVCQILYDMGAEEKTQVAGVLHDIIEDTQYSLEDINNHFGLQVANLVAGATEKARLEKGNGAEVSWKERKAQTHDHILETDIEVIKIKLADKLDNARAILKDYSRQGDDLWERFNAGKEDQKWYYEGLVYSFKKREPDFDDGMKVCFSQFKNTVKEIF